MSKSSKTTQTDQATAAKPASSQTAPRAPLLLEMTITLSQLGLVIAGTSIFALSLQAGADLITSALRSGAAVLVVGLVLWLVNWLLARGSLEAVMRQMREADQHDSHGTLDVNA